MRIDLLDVGTTKYGDCILVQHGQRSILIDGAHPGDTDLIRDQLEGLLGHAAPFEVDLLVVTHCHNDHIGCLPALIDSGDLTAKFALVADERFGWGQDAAGSDAAGRYDLTPSQRALFMALQEEPFSDQPPAVIERMIAEDATLDIKYGDMLKQLASRGSKVVRYGRSAASAVRELEAEFASFGLQILGPTREHLELCADAIRDSSDAIANLLTKSAVVSDARGGLAETYRALTRTLSDSVEFAVDRAGPGAAKNDQSIVLKVAADGWSALLAGDMQFAKAEVPDLNPLMTTLRGTVANAGPYDLIKLSHHTSYNGVDESFMDEHPATKLFAHTGGLNDPGHPDPNCLEMLKGRRDGLKFARTDHNGRITVEKKSGAVVMTLSKGRINDFTPNPRPDEPESAEIEPLAAAPVPASPPWTSIGSGRTGDMVEVYARVPHTATKVTLTLQVEPASQGATRESSLTLGRSQSGNGAPKPAEDVSTLKVGGGRRMPNLLFVTSRPRLEQNIGKAETDLVFRSIAATPNIDVLDLGNAIGSAEEAAGRVRPRLAENGYVGVVLLGGYDVVPSQSLDVLDPASRQALVDAGLDSQDADSFIVWNDELYGDKDGDFLPEMPVSRIPDGRRADVMLAALQASDFAAGTRFGVRNVARPFAANVFPSLPGFGGRLEVSERFASGDVPANAASGAVYYMLHGSARDATRFWGESVGGAAYEAFAIENVPQQASGSVVFTGCCWGALAMSPPASRLRPHSTLLPRGPEASLAIAYLRAGALAFVGCTGSHYSPLKAPYDYFGKPMHDSFWAAVNQGRKPAEALFDAKKEFARRLPHGREDSFSRAVEVKILRQYTCLGLGW